MHCAHCRSLMLQSRDESNAFSRQVWYECILCGHVQLTSELVTADSAGDRTMHARTGRAALAGPTHNR
jgi:hypothetical protein